MSESAPTDGYVRSVISVGRGTTVMVVSTVLLFLFSFLGRVAVARAFSVQSWGDFSLGIALTGFLSSVALLGLNQAVARSLSFERDPVKRRKVIRYGLSVTVAGSVISSLTVYLLAAPIASLFNVAQRSVLTSIFQLFSVTIGFTLLSMFLAAIFQGFENAGPNAWFNQVVNPGLFVAFVLLLLLFHTGFVGALVAYVLANAVAFGALAVYTWAKLPHLVPLRGPVPAGAPPGLWSFTLSLWGVSALSFVAAYVDTLILGAFRPETQVGYYSSGMTLARLLLVGSGTLTYIYLPVAARLTREKAYETIRRTYVTSTRWMLLITLPMFFLFAFLPRASLGAVFGGKYEPGATALAILAWGAFVSVMVGPANACLAGMGYARTLLSTSLLSAATNVVLSFALIPPYGLLGAAIAWTVTRPIYPGSGMYALWRSDRITPFRRTLVVPLVVALAVGVPIYVFLNTLTFPLWWVVPLFFLGAAIFLFALLLTKSLDPGDLVAARAVENLLGRPLPALRRFLERFVAPPVSVPPAT